MESCPVIKAKPPPCDRGTAFECTAWLQLGHASKREAEKWEQGRWMGPSPAAGPQEAHPAISQQIPHDDSDDCFAEGGWWRGKAIGGERAVKNEGEFKSVNCSVAGCTIYLNYLFSPQTPR